MKKLLMLLLLVLVFAGGMFFQKMRPVEQHTEQTKPVKYWVAPMDPTFRSDKPGKSPMGMDLVPVYDEDESSEKDTINISATVENNLGVKVAPVTQTDLAREITTVGFVTADENTIKHIHPFTDGWVKQLTVKTTGEFVKQGQLLLELFSPTLVSAQEEYLLAINNKNQSLIRAGEKKLSTLGMSESQIYQLRKSRQVTERVKIYSTQNGIVSALNIREGNYVKPETDIMTIEDLSSVWIIAEVFERQASWVAEGQPAMATFSYLPGKTWQGEVDYVYPELNQKTHTLRVRLKFPNPDLAIKPKMYANVSILSRTIENAIAIPRSALIRTGEGDRVILALGKGQYKAQSIKVGIESGDYYQVLSGLKAGDNVVTSAQFLIDSESNLKAAFNRMQDHSDLKDSIDTPNEFVGMGKIKAIDAEKKTLSLYHQPIPALNMPAMLMNLMVANDISLENLQLEDEIHFVMIKKNDGTFLIVKIHVVNDKAHQHQ